MDAEIATLEARRDKTRALKQGMMQELLTGRIQTGMSGRPQPSTFYIGWDVGGWNCDKNGKSRDALVILDAELKLVGRPWRGNLRTAINEAADASDWVNRLFGLCKACPAEPLPDHPGDRHSLGFL